MTNDSVRVCLFCSGEIPKWKSKGTKFCNPGCKFKFQEKEKRRVANPKISSGSILHQCLSNALDAAIPCKCRKRVSDKEANRLVSEGHVVNYKTRAPVFIDGEPLLIVGKHLKFPRAATVERPHIQRATQDLFTVKGKVRVKERTIEEMQRAIAQDKLERAEEELLRMEHYQFLMVQNLRIVQIPADQYDEMKANDPWRGRCIFAPSSDERTSKSEDVSEPKDSLLIEEAESDVLAEEEVEIEQHEDETENEDGLTVVTAEEMEEVV
jgi:hypothetical protein